MAIEEVERMKEEIARIKARSDGKEPPPRIPTTDEHHAEFNRISDAVCPVLVKYAKIVHKHNVAPDFNTEKLEQYHKELTKLARVDNKELVEKVNGLSFGTAAIKRRKELDNGMIIECIVFAVKQAKGRR